MNIRPIQPEEVRPGDKIQVTSVYEVIDAHTDVSGTVRFRFINPETEVPTGMFFTPNDEVILLSRPVPTLPTEYGSVVEIAGERWFFRESITGRKGVWISTQPVTSLTVEDAQDAAERAGGFTVLL